RSHTAANQYASPSPTFPFLVQSSVRTTDAGAVHALSLHDALPIFISVNDAPVGADNTVTTTEDGTYVFVTGDFPFTDPSDSPANIRRAHNITTLPTSGTLPPAAATPALAAGDFVSKADIVAGKLRF